jgi:hypothetical protein
MEAVGFFKTLVSGDQVLQAVTITVTAMRTSNFAKQ